MKPMTIDQLKAVKRRNTPKRACCGRPITEPHNLACKANGGPGVGKWQYKTRHKAAPVTANKGTE